MLEVEVFWASKYRDAKDEEGNKIREVVWGTWQKKSFKDGDTAFAWVRAHQDNIFGVNRFREDTKLVSDKELMKRIKWQFGGYADKKHKAEKTA